MISSARLPRVALSSPPTVGPVWTAISSVALPRKPDRGTIASALSAKTITGGACASSAPIATGTNSRSRASNFIGGRGARSERGRLVQQHDRDVVAHRVSQATVRARQRRLGLVVFQGALALRAHEDREQLGGECHVEESSWSR